MLMRRCVRVLGLVLALLPGLARADWTITQEVEAGSRKDTFTLQVHATHMRVDMGGQLVYVLDSATGDTLHLKPAAKTYSRVTAEESKALGAKLAATQGTPAAAPAAPAPTGQTTNIGGHAAQLYTWAMGEMKMRFWITTAWPEGTRAQADLDRFQSIGLASAAGHLMPSFAEFPGLRIRTEMELGKRRWQYTITSVKEETLPPELFAVPKDYREIPFAVEGPAAAQP